MSFLSGSRERFRVWSNARVSLLLFSEMCVKDRMQLSSIQVKVPPPLQFYVLPDSWFITSLCFNYKINPLKHNPAHGINPLVDLCLILTDAAHNGQCVPH